MNNVVGLTSNDLALSSTYKQMLERVQSAMPAITHASENFHKSHSQYMGAMLDVTAITPIRRIKHILAEIDRTRMALEEAYIKQRKADIERRRIEARKATATEALDVEHAEVELLELDLQAGNVRSAIQGAVRKLSFFVTQYQSVMASLGKEQITEEDYEREEDRYHIMTAMKQALIAARARGGVIDEGNHIYLFDLGISGAQAQSEVVAYLQMEGELMQNGKAPTHEMTMAWLDACADKFAGCALRSAGARGYTLLDEQSLVTVKT